jgi:hypothetical protein
LHGSTPLHEYDAMINFAFTMLDDKTWKDSFLNVPPWLLTEKRRTRYQNLRSWKQEEDWKSDLRARSLLEILTFNPAILGGVQPYKGEKAFYTGLRKHRTHTRCMTLLQSKFRPRPIDILKEGISFVESGLRHKFNSRKIPLVHSFPCLRHVERFRFIFAGNQS